MLIMIFLYDVTVALVGKVSTQCNIGLANHHDKLSTCLTSAYFSAHPLGLTVLFFRRSAFSSTIMLDVMQTGSWIAGSLELSCSFLQYRHWSINYLWYCWSATVLCCFVCLNDMIAGKYFKKKSKLFESWFLKKHICKCQIKMHPYAFYQNFL